MNDNTPPFDDEEEYKSKTEIKREMHELRDLGKALIELPEKELATIPVPDNILEQIAIAKKITHNSGKKRQMQYIGKLLRSIDTDEIQAAYEDLQTGRKKLARDFQKLEVLRDQLIDQGDNAIQPVLEQYPNADRQILRQLVRQASKEKQAEKPPAAARKLFKYLREISDS